MNNYFKSDNVIVFPASLRSANARSVYTSEINLTQMVKSGASYPSYLLSAELDNISEEVSGNLKMIIGGYYFEVTLPGADLKYKDFENGVTFSINAGVEKENTSSTEKENTFINLLPIEGDSLDDDLDDNGVKQFVGLKLSSGATSAGNTTSSLTIKGTWTNNNTFIPDDRCYARYNSKYLVYDDRSRVPTITSKYLSDSTKEISESDWPSNPKPGDIFIVYGDN